MNKTVALCAALVVALVGCSSKEKKPESAAGVPQFKVDPFWPKPLPSNWMLGQVAGIGARKLERYGEDILAVVRADPSAPQIDAGG